MTTKDKDIWQAYTERVLPVKTRKVKPASEKRKTSLKSEIRKPVSSPSKSEDSLPLKAPTPLKPLPSTLLERKREKSLRHGELEIEGKLDLHGLTQAEAFDALAAFLQRMLKSNKRNLLIITGKGKQNKGVLRSNLATWLEQLSGPKHVLALRPSAPKHGGEGAFYLILRKQKPL